MGELPPARTCLPGTDAITRPDLEAGARVTELSEYIRVLDYLQAQGYNEVDTARAYVAGKQEAHTREAGWKERGLKLATKASLHLLRLTICVPIWRRSSVRL